MNQLRTWISLAFFCLCSFVGQGQNLIWEKKLPLSTYETFSCVTKASNGNFLALGSSEKWLILNPVQGGAIIMKFNENGDTLWTKFTGYYGGFNKVVTDNSGNFYALLGYHDTSLNKFKWGIYIFNEDGQNLGVIPIQTTGTNTLLDMEYRNGFIWISGQKNPSIFYPSVAGSFDFLLMKLRTDGTEVFSFVYNANEASSRGRMMEFMPNGNILFSGTAGTKLCAFEIDTSGNQIQYRNYLTNSANTGWQGAFVSQSADGNRLVGGYRSTNPDTYYLGMHDTSGTAIWGGYKTGYISTHWMNQDSTSIITTGAIGTPGRTTISRIRSNSAVVWSKNIYGTAITGYKYPSDIWYNEDESGIIVGNVFPASFSPKNLYICKFSGLGIPFNPTSAKAMESLQTHAEPIPFPNPGGGNVKFTILAGPGQVSFTDMQGRTIWKGEYLPEKGISTQTFPSGLYQYRLERNGKVWTGKWEKN
jgi:hypothetical protein